LTIIPMAIQYVREDHLISEGNGHGNGKDGE
jgi:hypothetical protein